jgi:hypothetical protein
MIQPQLVLQDWSASIGSNVGLYLWTFERATKKPLLFSASGSGTFVQVSQAVKA